MNGEQSFPDDDRGDKAPSGLQDSALRNRFVSIREEEQRHIPAFASLWGRGAGAPHSNRFWRVAAACVVILVAAILLLHSKRPNKDEVLTVSISEWKAPTDFLLETPGREILQTVPEIGNWQLYTVATPAESGHSQVKKKVLH